MKLFYAILGKVLFFALLIGFVVLCVNNTQQVDFNIFLDHKFTKVPLFVVIFASIVFGSFINLIFILLTKPFKNR